MCNSIALIAISLALTVTACSSNSPADNEPFETLQDCYDDHHSGGDHLPIQEAIVTCCLDHPIARMKAPTCPKVPEDCKNQVRTALPDPSILDADITAACMTYINALTH
jgi:hypothetical protein